MRNLSSPTFNSGETIGLHAASDQSDFGASDLRGCNRGCWNYTFCMTDPPSVVGPAKRQRGTYILKQAASGAASDAGCQKQGRHQHRQGPHRLT
jgi:hypothetical protein